MGTINSSMHAVQQAQADLNEVDNLPPLGQDMVSFSGPSWKWILMLWGVYRSVIIPGSKVVLVKLLK